MLFLDTTDSNGVNEYGISNGNGFTSESRQWGIEPVNIFTFLFDGRTITNGANSKYKIISIPIFEDLVQIQSSSIVYRIE